MDITTSETATLVKETPEHVLQAPTEPIFGLHQRACQAAAAPMRLVDSVGGCPCEGDGCTLQVTARGWKLLAERAKYAAEILPRFSAEFLAENCKIRFSLQFGAIFEPQGHAEICPDSAEILLRFFRRNSGELQDRI